MKLENIKERILTSISVLIGFLMLAGLICVFSYSFGNDKFNPKNSNAREITIPKSERIIKVDVVKNKNGDLLPIIITKDSSNSYKIYQTELTTNNISLIKVIK